MSIARESEKRMSSEVLWNLFRDSNLSFEAWREKVEMKYSAPYMFVDEILGHYGTWVAYRHSRQQTRKDERDKQIRREKRLRIRVEKQASVGYYDAIRAENHRAKRRGLEHDLTVEQWNCILDFYDHSCAYCGETGVPLNIDHFIPVSKGGGTTALNVVPACVSCNCSKSNKIKDLSVLRKVMDEWREGLYSPLERSSKW